MAGLAVWRVFLVAGIKEQEGTVWAKSRSGSIREMELS